MGSKIISELIDLKSRRRHCYCDFFSGNPTTDFDLGNITDKPMDSNNLVPVKIAQLVKEFPFINWTVFFQSAFNPIDNTFSIDQDTEILIQVITDSFNQYQGCTRSIPL